MGQFEDRLVQLFASLDERLERRPLLVSVRRGLIYIIPLVLIGSFALVVLSLPVPSYQAWLVRTFGEQWRNVFDYLRDGTFGILSLILVLSISYSAAVEHAQRRPVAPSPIIAAAVSLSSFVAVSGISKAGFSIASFGAIGVFVAIVVAVISSRLFLALCSLRSLQLRAFTDGAYSTFNSAVAAIYPAAITVLVFAAINQALAGWFEIDDIQTYISTVFSSLLMQVQTPFWRGMLFVFSIHLFWFLGMHGSNLLEPIAQGIYVPALAANRAEIALGQAPREIFTKTFFDTFVLMGGCGAAICLVLAMLLWGRQHNQRRLARLSAIPVLCNINELVIFGIPIVLNPVYLIPFMLTPLILTMTSYLAVRYGLVPYTSRMVEWTTPILLSGYASTGAPSGSLLQLFNLALGTVCYLPFVRLAERVADARARKNLQRVCAELNQGARPAAASSLLARQDEIGELSRALAMDLQHDLQQGRVAVFFQPQVNFAGRVFDMEALLRWQHRSHGYIYPPLVVALAEEAQLIDQLGGWVLDRAGAALAQLEQQGIDDVCVSVNVSALQLEDGRFIEQLREVLQRYRIAAHQLQVEITEQTALASSERVIGQIKAIKQLGCRLAMDDFGMGHSSLLYLKEYQFDTIKVDGSLVRELLTNQNCSNIISSIVFLSQSLNYAVVAEYVEQEEQRRLLHELGCDRYQGYLYSPAVPIEQLASRLSAEGRLMTAAQGTEAGQAAGEAGCS